MEKFEFNESNCTVRRLTRLIISSINLKKVSNIFVTADGYCGYRAFIRCLYGWIDTTKDIEDEQVLILRDVFYKPKMLEVLDMIDIFDSYQKNVAIVTYNNENKVTVDFLLNHDSPLNVIVLYRGHYYPLIKADPKIKLTLNPIYGLDNIIVHKTNKNINDYFESFIIKK